MIILNIIFENSIIPYFKDNSMPIAELILFYQLYIILLQTKIQE